MITALHIENLAVQRGERVLFRGLDLTLTAGEAVALTGANGSGKTSLLRTVAGLIRPLAGEVRFGGPGGALDARDARREGCHLIGHQDGLKPGRTAGEELMFQTRWTGGAGEAALAVAEAWGLTRLLDLEVRVLSAGQRRRLALARLIAAPRALWLLDEPLAPLDQASRAVFAAAAADHLARGGLLLAAIHDPLPIEARTMEIGG
ncbi:MAG: heme ABC exporter ATP-binding protein CcmA [Pseudomonadota bacterium]